MLVFTSSTVFVCCALDDTIMPKNENNPVIAATIMLVIISPFPVPL